MDDLAALLDRLVAADVLVETDDDRLDLGSGFRRERERRRADLDDQDLSQARERYAASLDVDPDAPDLDVVLDAVTVQALDEEFTDREAAVVADALARFDDDRLTEGAPDGFVPVRPAEIPAFLERHEGSVLYFWGDDCEPCEFVHAELNELVRRDEVPDGLGLGAVYLGTEAEISEADVDRIAGDYQVAVVPTTLFFEDTDIHSRLIGAKNGGHLRREMEILVAEYLDEGRDPGEWTESKDDFQRRLEAKERGEIDDVVEPVADLDAEAALAADIEDQLAAEEADPSYAPPVDVEDIMASDGEDELSASTGETAADDERPE